MSVVAAGCVPVHSLTESGSLMYSAALKDCKKSNDALLSLSGEGSEFDSSSGQKPLTDDG